MKWFDYAAPTSVREAVELLAAHPRAQLLAGGTDLLVQLRAGRKETDLVVDVKRIPELNALEYDPARGLTEIRRVLHPAGELRMLEHVRAATPWRARMQDVIQPVWTWIAGGCHPNRDTEAAVARAGFTIDDRRAEGTMRRFRARL